VVGAAVTARALGFLATNGSSMEVTIRVANISQEYDLAIYMVDYVSCRSPFAV
jgi:hypothetical protein